MGAEIARSAGRVDFTQEIRLEDLTLPTADLLPSREQLSKDPQALGVRVVREASGSQPLLLVLPQSFGSLGPIARDAFQHRSRPSESCTFSVPSGAPITLAVYNDANQVLEVHRGVNSVTLGRISRDGRYQLTVSEIEELNTPDMAGGADTTEMKLPNADTAVLKPQKAQEHSSARATDSSDYHDAAEAAKDAYRSRQLGNTKAALNPKNQALFARLGKPKQNPK